MEYYLVVNLNKLNPIDGNTSAIPPSERCKYTHHSEVLALEQAQSLAERHPKDLIGIFKAVKTLETKAPTFISKVFNDQGELLPL